jgi:NAD(P)H-nitrite reductase large subunit
VTVVDGFETPFYNTLGKEVGSALQSFHQNKGIKFELKKSVKKITDNSVELADGSALQADLVLMATGVLPNSVIIHFL